MYAIEKENYKLFVQKNKGPNEDYYNEFLLAHIFYHVFSSHSNLDYKANLYEIKTISQYFR